MTAIAPFADVDLALRVVELEELLERERARRAGLERGIESLIARLEELRRENAELREATSLV